MPSAPRHSHRPRWPRPHPRPCSSPSATWRPRANSPRTGCSATSRVPAPAKRCGTGGRLGALSAHSPRATRRERAGLPPPTGYAPSQRRQASPQRWRAIPKGERRPWLAGISPAPAATIRLEGGTTHLAPVHTLAQRLSPLQHMHHNRLCNIQASALSNCDFRVTMFRTPWRT